ncbi:F-box protein CPR1-like [Nicotiana tomentosiformis]|uniref:F-box protein CPR1-like n=1 Tax=Nicotiana tomentosiformis TaxID=4098 RepID=UPI00051ADF37|nr:F-box protein CPR1-like [Nicotiana tomentosiformis]
MAEGITYKFPKDVVIYIILKLPIKSLLQFKCVSKSWYTLMQSYIFINLHLNRTTTADDEIILFKRSFKEEANQFRSIMSFLSSCDDNDDFYHVSPDLDVPYLTTTTSCVFHRFMGPCRGLIVLMDKVTTVLFNPSTRNYRLLKPSPFGSPLGFHRSINGLAFGFDKIANEYKIVRLAEVRGEPPFYCFTTREWRVEVYELSTDSWREVDDVDQQLPYVHWNPCAELFYKGTSHWFGNTNTVVILCFDMSTETFRNIKMPDTCHSKDRKCYGLVVMKDSLTLICYPYPGCEIYPAIDFMEIWVMKEYGVNESWSKKYTITPLAIESPLAIWKEHILFLQSISGHLISYDLNSDEVKELGLHGWPESLRVTIYKESLTLILKGSEHYIEVQ